MRMSQDRAHALIQALWDPDDKFWWTLHGLLLFTKMARLAAGRKDKAPEIKLRVSGPELRFWLTFFDRLRTTLKAA